MSEAIKSEIINNVIVAMSYYISEKEILEALEHIISNELVKVNVQDITTMPETWQSDTQKRNQYLIQLFMIKKRSLSHQTMEGYLRAVKRLMTAVNKPLDQIGTVDIDWYLSQYERRKGINGEKLEKSTYNNERRFLSAFYTWMRKAKLIEENPVEATEPKRVIVVL